MVAMPLGFYFIVPLLNLLLAISVHCKNAPEGVRVECRDRYLWVSIDKILADRMFQVEAFDDAGVYPITEKYASECGYTLTYDLSTGSTILRASYLSCHTDNPTSEVFVFNFNLIVSDHGAAVSVPVSQTCSLSLPWSNREVICEHKYIEVSVNLPCPSSEAPSKVSNATKAIDHGSATNGHKVLFLKGGEEVASISTADARTLGYVIDTTADRIVLRTAYAQPYSEIKTIDGIPVEVIHVTVVLQQGWTVVMNDVTGACTTNLGSFDGEKLLWETPLVMTPLMYDHSGFVSQHIRIGVEGQLLDESTTVWGYTLDIHGNSVWIGIPYSAQGGQRWSFVQENTYHEYYSVHLYYEHLFMDGSGHLSRLRQVKKLASPLLFQVPFTIDQTILEERHFTVYLGNFPFDVELLAVVLNGEPFTVPEANLSGYPITKVPHSNGTHAYVIKVPFEDPIVPKTYFKEGVLQYSLAINYTLNIIPQDPYYHLASVIAQINDVFPPDFNGVCTETGIIFKMDHQKLSYLWEVGIGHYPLTAKLAADRGYILQNDSQSLILEVPVFTIGYIYEDISLQQFFGTFEILSRDAKSLEIQKSTAKRCLFKTDELIVCSSDGVMTVVASVTATLPDAEPSRATLLDTNCKPDDYDETRVLFAIKVNECGTRVMVDDSYIIYENEILINRELLLEEAPVITRDAEFRLTVQCYYPVNDVNRLFVDRKFKTPGFGSIKQTSQSNVKDVPKQTIPPATVAPVPKRTLPPTTLAPVPKRTLPPTTLAPVPKRTDPPTTLAPVTKKVTTPLGPVRYIRVTLG